MAASVPDPTSVAPDFFTLRMKFADIYGETAIKTFYILGTVANTAIATFLDALDALSNGAIEYCTLIANYTVTGLTATASSNSQNRLAEYLAVTLVGNNPLTDKPKRASFIVPAWIQALIDVDNKPVTTDANLNAVIAFLETNLMFEDQSGVMTQPDGDGWSYNRSMSGFGSNADEINGLSY